MAKRLLILTISLVLATIAWCQPQIRLAFNKKISIDDGLSSYNIKKIFQDRYGFIWILTQDGLNRYDGKNFLIYNKSIEADHQLLASDVWDIEQDSNNDILWVVTSYGGLNGISLKTGKVCVTLQAKISKGGFNHDWLRCLKLSNGKLWIGTYDGLTVYNVSSNSFERFDPLPFKKVANESFCIDKLFIDQYENIWIFIANYGIAIYSSKKKNVVNYYPLARMTLENKSTYKQFNSVTSLSDGNLLIGTNQGFRRITYNEKGLTEVLPGLFNNDDDFNRNSIEACSIDSSGHVWFSSASKLFKADIYATTVEEVKDARINLQNDWFNYIYDIFFDRSNNIWLGTAKGVTYTKNAIPAFTPYNISEDQTTKIDHAFYVYPYNDTILYTCAETALLKINVRNNRIVNLDNGKRYYFIIEHKDKNMLVSSEDSFFVYRPLDNRFFAISQFYPELTSLKSISVNSVIYIGDSLAIIGTQTAEGCYIWNYKKGSLTKLQSPNTLEATESNIVNTCYKDAKNRIWILGNKLITAYDQNSKDIRTINLINETNKIPYSLFFDICEARGYFWIAAYGSGLIQVDNKFAIKKVFSTREGLPNSGVYKVFPVHDSLIFITTNYGLSVLNLNTQSFSNYYREDGLHSNAFEQSCGISKNGKIFVGGINGFTSIDPAYFTTNSIPPKLYLNRVRIETEAGFSDTSNILLNTLDIPNNALQVTISFSALNYSNPSRTTYAYKMGELNSNWIHLGSQSFVSLIGLNPGKHTLLIRSANENNVWNDKPLQITLHYLPKWYQTLLFKIGVFAAIVVLLYLFFAYRISQLKKQQKIRRDISADLHDDFGGILQSVKNFTHLAKKEPEKHAHLNGIEDSLKQATVAFRDVIWILDDKEDTIHQFIERVRKFALPMANASSIHLECWVDREINDKIFSKAEKRHLLMIVKESITNSIKYSDCKNITVAIRLVNNRTAILIEDDGKGFNVETESAGNGLKNLVYRASQIRYRAEVVSRMGEGTKVRVVKI